MTTAVEVPLTKGYVALIDEEDAPIVLCRNWHVNVCRNRRVVYAQSDNGAKGKTKFLFLHRLIASRMGIPSDHRIDHENGNGVDCRRENLRSATHGQNMCNIGLTRTNKSGFKGVSLSTKGVGFWYAHISFNDKTRFLGSFGTPEAAARVYDEWARAGHGEFAWLNFPDSD